MKRPVTIDRRHRWRHLYREHQVCPVPLDAYNETAADRIAGCIIAILAGLTIGAMILAALSNP